MGSHLALPVPHVTSPLPASTSLLFFLALLFRQLTVFSCCNVPFFSLSIQIFLLQILPSSQTPSIRPDSSFSLSNLAFLLSIFCVLHLKCLFPLFFCPNRFLSVLTLCRMFVADLLSPHSHSFCCGGRESITYINYLVPLVQQKKL